MAPKQYKQRERRYVPEYVDEKFPERVAAFYNMPIGPAPEELHKAYPEVPLEHFRRWRFFVDAVVVLQDRMILIEGKIRKPAAGLGQLLIYRALLPQTPELKPYANLPIEMRLVTPRPDPRIIWICSSLGITVDIWTKPWVQQYLHELGLA
ncbi:MAG: hypothetical protein DRJ03_23710 [Chloroflexi bacterium]|nr:MAG: hypothetical protein DRJ03_23710 [Chloroflexota bacterium]